MEEKKLTDEKLVTYMEYCTQHSCSEDCPLINVKRCMAFMLKQSLDLIQRLWKENAKQKAEIERLTEREKFLENAWHTSIEHIETVERGLKASEARNAELQKQVEELKEERENMQAVIFGLEEEKRLLKEQVDELKSKEGSFKVGTSVVATTKENDLIGYYGTIVKVQPGEVLVEFNMVNGVKGFRAWLKSSEFVEVE